MNKGDVFQARIERIAAGGEGTAFIENHIVFTAYTAPGDLVRLKIIEINKNRAVGELLEIVEPSPLRTKPKCRFYGKCGGCNLQHLSYQAQLAAKVEIIRDCFMRIGGITLDESILSTTASEPFGYRNRMQFHCSPDDRSVTGFMAQGKNEVIPVTECPVADIGIQKAVETKSIRPPPEKDRFSVYSANGSLLIEGEKNRGKVNILSKELRIDAGQFFQSNAGMLELLINELVKTAGDANHDQPMADLYCGVGTFAVFLAENFPEIELVEKSKPSLNLAKENLDKLTVKKRFFAVSCDEWAKQKLSRNRHIGFAIADPPRQGLGTILKKWINAKGPEMLFYVSCDPVSLARDTKEIAGSNSAYNLEKLSLYDFYPQTSHIESLAIFYRKKQ